MHRTRKTIGAHFAGVAMLLLPACSPASLVDVQPPSTVVDPATVTTAAGATQLYNYAITHFSQVYGGANNYVINTALMTDETMRVQGGAVFAVYYDERTGSTLGQGINYGTFYQTLHQPRVEAQQAREGLLRYAPATPRALQGQLQALEAYAVIWLAELFCSGIPLTSVPLVGTPVPTAGFTTQQLLERAAAMFDSAIVLGADTARFVNLAKVGKGRALLGLGRFADAATAVQGVPTDFVYSTEYSSAIGANGIGNSPRSMQVVDGEGGNGLTWSTDPRTATTTTPVQSGPMKISGKYSRTSGGTVDAVSNIVDNPIRLADGLEARLIEAEADLANGGGSWLTTLNTLRNTCVGTAVCAPVPGLTTANLPPLTDPGTANARLDLVMRERAMWLYLTGHRQGDLRRLGRVYQRPVPTLWPTGTYSNPGFSPLVPAATTNGLAYGNDVVWGPNSVNQGLNESVGNSLYTGCFNFDP